MIYEVSRCYNTPERITSLLVKITNQLITLSRSYIMSSYEDSNIWSMPYEEFEEKVNACSQLNESYQKAYQNIKIEIEQEKGTKIEISENYVFGKMNSFCERLDLVRDTFRLIEKFKVIKTIDTDGIDQIVGRYDTVVENLLKKDYDLLDYRKAEVSFNYLQKITF